MTEKEFLKCFLEYAEVSDYDLDDNLIQTWLDYHHTSYYEVEFISKDVDIDKHYDYHSIAGLKVVVDESIPDGEIHIKDGDKVLGKLVDIPI